MMGEPVDVVAEAEEYVSALRREWVAPRDRECVACYVGRMLDEFGCDNRLRWVGLWRDACAPRATALERRLASRGGFCDCEVALNVFPEQMLLPEDEPRPPCDGVSRRGSTAPCRRSSSR